MRSPQIPELPAPPPGKHGWPWTEETPPLPDTMPDGRPWPRIAIVTPSYNQGRFLEAAIRSVLLQGYPNLEYSVVDGGSSDESVEIIRRYSPWLSSWVSEPDRGQAHAINKGFARATGDLVAWINSDDLYLPGAFRLLAEAHGHGPGMILAGDVESFHDGEEGSILVRQWNLTLPNLADPWNGRWSGHQPGWFVPRALGLAAGPLDEGLRYAFDRDWLCRLLQRAEVSYLGVPVARFRIHGAGKTTAEVPAAVREVLQVARRCWDLVPDLDTRYIEAVHGIQEATVYLGDHPSYAPFWDRGAAVRRLLITWRRYPRIAGSAAFWKLCLRAASPRWALRLRRAVASRLRGHGVRA